MLVPSGMYGQLGSSLYGDALESILWLTAVSYKITHRRSHRLFIPLDSLPLDSTNT